LILPGKATRIGRRLNNDNKLFVLQKNQERRLSNGIYTHFKEKISGMKLLLHLKKNLAIPPLCRFPD
jgi:hypothetical protein